MALAVRRIHRPFYAICMADAAIRSAPWGTRLPVFIHHTDYRTRRIVVGQRRPSPPDDLGNVVLVETASADVRQKIERAFESFTINFLADRRAAKCWTVQDQFVHARGDR